MEQELPAPQIEVGRDIQGGALGLSAGWRQSTVATGAVDPRPRIADETRPRVADDSRGRPATGPRAANASRSPVADDSRARVAAVVRRHERTLLRVARQASMCDDDALDAYQRALEIFVRRVESVDPATELAWLRVVVRNEALAIRRTRSESVTGEDLDLDAFVPNGERSVEERIVSEERVRRSAEALRALKPDEAQALMMKAHGLSYDEIGRRQGWSYTKVNRAITEGRRRFMRAYEGLESGEECARYTPIVEALAAGTASSAQIIEIRPHLRHCTACRASVRELHVPRLRRISLFSPLLVLLEPLHRLLSRSHIPEDMVEHIRPVDEIVTVNPDLPPAGPPDPELPLPTATDHGLHLPSHDSAGTSEALNRLATLKQDLTGLLYRANASDVATGLHVSTSSGGGRMATLAATLGLCASGLGAGTVCVMTDIIPWPTDILTARPGTTDSSSPADRRSARRQPTRERPVESVDAPPTEPTRIRAHEHPKPLQAADRVAHSRTAPGRESAHTQRDAARGEFGFENRALNAAAASPSRRPQAIQPAMDASAASQPPPSVGAQSNPPTPSPAAHEFNPAQQEFKP